jgi:hypothetical protein
VARPTLTFGASARAGESRALLCSVGAVAKLRVNRFASDWVLICSYPSDVSGGDLFRSHGLGELNEENGVRRAQLRVNSIPAGGIKLWLSRRHLDAGASSTIRNQR